MEDNDDDMPNESSFSGDNENTEPLNFASEMRKQQRADVKFESSFEYIVKNKGNLYVCKNDELLCGQDQVGDIDVHQLILPVEKR